MAIVQVRHKDKLRADTRQSDLVMMTMMMATVTGNFHRECVQFREMFEAHHGSYFF